MDDQVKTDWLHRVAHSWIPEVVGAVLALATIAVGPRVVHAVSAFESQAEQAAAFDGPPWRGFLDVEVEAAPGVTGVEVQNVMANGASQGVLHAGDIITAVDGVSTPDLTQLRDQLWWTRPGEVVRLSVLRAGRQPGSAASTVTVRLGDNPNFAEPFGSAAGR